jgi:hypothetical protein
MVLLITCVPVCVAALQVHPEHMRYIRRGSVRGSGLAVKQHCTEVLSAAAEEASGPAGAAAALQLAIDGGCVCSRYHAAR